MANLSINAVYPYQLVFQKLIEDERISKDKQSDQKKYEKLKTDVDKVQPFIQNLLKVDNYYQFIIAV